MTEKQIIDRLDSINLSLRQKKDLIDIIKDIADNSSGGGGTSTDKDALYIYIDISTYNITINDKVYITSQGDPNALDLTITDKELYDTLYNFLYNTNRSIYIKSLPNDELYLFGICTGGGIDKSRVALMFLTVADIITIIVHN